MSSCVYIVEKVVDKRIKNDRIQYLLKWKGWSSAYNTWEPIEHLNCDKLIEKYEQRQKHLTPITEHQPSIREQKIESSSVMFDNCIKSICHQSSFKTDNPFKNGEHRLEKILGLRQCDDESMEFHCKLRGIKRGIWISNKIVNECYPRDVIQFYQQSLEFDD
ncbi:unnamed protein product [Didymodactylos carnosus]|uniref:Chromo domain-containing protein n=1 Tax=Didymodactylos carnosus TaxID=1234261 RepID=A0A815EMH7_9BILA|nr:unnamed protein product [Didymodactylos carnosus]CAF1316780.1 unnamed protein product [Didymodactylos carnosus]CAF4073953.1 unnamed protein product [Didymodactylos carnosus]CAF4159228.1 unnamed protein product [Didymodactylos carnosus]